MICHWDTNTGNLVGPQMRNWQMTKSPILLGDKLDYCLRSQKYSLLPEAKVLSFAGNIFFGSDKNANKFENYAIVAHCDLLSNKLDNSATNWIIAELRTNQRRGNISKKDKLKVGFVLVYIIWSTCAVNKLLIDDLELVNRNGCWATWNLWGQLSHSHKRLRLSKCWYLDREIFLCRSVCFRIFHRFCEQVAATETTALSLQKHRHQHLNLQERYLARWIYRKCWQMFAFCGRNTCFLPHCGTFFLESNVKRAQHGLSLTKFDVDEVNLGLVQSYTSTHFLRNISICSFFHSLDHICWPEYFS